VVVSPSSFGDWIAWGGLVLPLIAIAVSAVRYVWLLVEQSREKSYSRFFELMDQLGRQEYSIAAKVAAAHELRRFPRYKDVIVRLCETADVTGTNAEMLERELHLTARHFGSPGRKGFEK